MHPLDRAVSWFSPRAGLQRMRAREALVLAERAYAAAGQDQRTRGWRVAGGSANSAAGLSPIVRDRVRQLVRDNGYAAKALNTLADYVVGTGIVGTPVSTGKMATKLAITAYADWCDQADFTGHHDWHGLQKLALRGMFESGEVLVRRRRRDFRPGEAVAPVQIEVMEPELLDVAKNGTLASGGLIDGGIEYDAVGRKVAFWLLPQHPGDVAIHTRNRWQSDRVPADQVIHLFDRQRPGQDRGVSLFAPAVMPLHELQGYLEAERVRKRISACMAVFVTTDGENEPVSVDGKVSLHANMTTQKLAPGMIQYMRPGEEVTVATPQTDSGVAEFTQVVLREVAAGTGTMYEAITGDFSNVNYSSWRAGKDGFNRRVEDWQWLLAIPLLCRRVGGWFSDAALAGGQMRAPAKLSWEAPGFPSVDPEKDAKADLLNLRMGKITPSELAAQRGWNYLEFLDQYAADLAAADQAFEKLGAVKFDGDPRKSTAKGNGDANSDRAGKPGAGSGDSATDE